MNVAILWYSRKFSLRNLGGVAPLALQKHEQSVKVFSVKIVSFTNSRKFYPSKVSRYTVRKICEWPVIEAVAVLGWSSPIRVG